MSSLPPFANELDPACREIRLYMGSDAWDAARIGDTGGTVVINGKETPVSNVGRRLLMPPDSEPEDFRWPVAGKDVLIVVHGIPFSLAKLVVRLTLAGAGAIRVLVRDGDEWTMGVLKDG